MGTHQNTPPRLLLGQREGNQPDGIFLFQAWQGWGLCCCFCSQGGTAARGGADPWWGTRHRGGQGRLHGQGEAAGCCLPVSASPTQQPQHPKTHPGVGSAAPGPFGLPPALQSCVPGREGEPAAKPQWQQKENWKEKKKKATKEKNPVRAARRIACTGEKHCSGCAEEQSLYKSKQHSELFELAESTALAFSPALPPLGTRGCAVPHQRSHGDLPPRIYCCSCENLPGEPPMRGAGWCPRHRAPCPGLCC